MPAPARPQLKGSTVNRKWWVDINTGTHDAPVWTPIRGVTSLTPNTTSSVQDDSSFDSRGWGSDIITAHKWSLEIQVSRSVDLAAPTVYDAGQEFLRKKAEATGIANVVDIRWYEMNIDDDGVVIGPKTEAHRGIAAAQYANQGGAYDTASTATITLSGRGRYEDIEHPEGGSLPAVLGLAPATGAAAGGTLVIITGSNLTGATAVKFGTTNAASFTVINDSQIAAVSPSHTAGGVEVSVTTPAGVSTTTKTFTFTS